MTRATMSAALALLVSLAACRNEPLSFEEPVWPDGGHLGGTTPLSDPEKAGMDGLYVVSQGKEMFGDTVVLKWSGNYLTVFTGKDVKFMITQAGNTGTNIYVEGYWRSQNSTNTGLVQFSGPAGGATTPLTGTFGNGSDEPTEALTLTFLRPINPSQLVPGAFWNISHHLSGGAPLILPHSENTVEMLKEIERYGANGVEIDVRPTKDGIPILYHDTGLNWRLTQKGPLVGPVEDYNFDQIEASVRLLHGEKIPSLAAFLDTLIVQTNIEFVYVDLKTTTVDAMPAILSVLDAARTKATNLGRNVLILPALTTDDVFASFASQPGYPNLPSMCELTLDQLHQANSEVWSPRFTSGFTKEEVAQLHTEGRKVVTWTVNVPSLIDQYIFDVGLDGLDSDYNTLVAWYWYKH